MSSAEPAQLNVIRFQHKPDDAVVGSSAATALDAHRRSAAYARTQSGIPDALRLAFLRVREDLRLGGWILIAEPEAQAADHLIVRFVIRRDDVVVSTCGFAIGPGRTVVFGRPAERAVKGALDTMGEAEFRHLIGTWTREVQAGVGHRWRYEAKVRGKGDEECHPAN
jgi:hypothetical protein